MAISIDVGNWPQGWNDLDAMMRLQNILLDACEGQRDSNLDADYQALRQALISNPEFNDLTPRPVRTSRDLRAFWAYIKDFAPQWEPRRKHVREFMEALLERAEQLDATGALGANYRPDDPDAPMLSSKWTGVPTSAERARAVRQLVPTAMFAVETLIAHFETLGGNGGPPLEEREEALNALRDLHEALGRLLQIADSDAFIDEHEGLLSEIAGYGRRVTTALRDDPMPYAASILVMALGMCFGVGDVAGLVSGAALGIRRSQK